MFSVHNFTHILPLSLPIQIYVLSGPLYKKTHTQKQIKTNKNITLSLGKTIESHHVHLLGFSFCTISQNKTRTGLVRITFELWDIL